MWEEVSYNTLNPAILMSFKGYSDDWQTKPFKIFDTLHLVQLRNKLRFWGLLMLWVKMLFLLNVFINVY